MAAAPSDAWLQSLITDAFGTTVIDGGAVTTNGDQFYGDAVDVDTLDVIFDGANITFDSTLDSTGNVDVTVNTNGGGIILFKEFADWAVTKKLDADGDGGDDTDDDAQ